MVVAQALIKTPPSDIRRAIHQEADNHSSFSPIEFIFRGTYRISHDNAIKREENNLQKAKVDLKNALGKIAAINIPERASKEEQDSVPLTFYDRIHGADRKKLQKTCKNAEQDFYDFDEIELKIESAISELNKTRNQFRQCIERRYFTAYTAEYYNRLNVFGWTWWR